MYCTNCGNKTNNEEMFCSKCGKGLAVLEDVTKCPKCSADRNVGNFCTKCGFKYSYRQPSTIGTKVEKPRSNLKFNLTLVASILLGLAVVFLASYYS